ncbi:MAG: hypothetical protein LBO70_08745 [Clostridiales Family XIII bacterium]|nr:hypothetical protein [Clostridiales Family XIII bacterium]
MSFFAALCALLVAALLFTGCAGSSANSSDSEAPTSAEGESANGGSEASDGQDPGDLAATDAGTEAPEEAPPHDLIFAAPEGGTTHMYVTNMLGQEIVSISARHVGEKKFGSVLKVSGISWGDTKTALVEYGSSQPAEGTASAVSTDAGQGYLCDIQMKLSDGAKATIHSVDLGVINEITLRSMDGVAFITYAGTDGKEVSTYELEKALAVKAEEKAEEKAKAEKEEKKTYKPPSKKKKKADDECVDDIVLR